MNEMVQARDSLVSLGQDGWIHSDYDKYVEGTHPDLKRYDSTDKNEKAQIKIDRDYFKVHYKNILESDAVFVVNLTKDGNENYIGGNALIEMGQAYVNNKKIFLLNNIPTYLSYSDEIKAMLPICLNGNIENIKDYLN